MSAANRFCLSLDRRPLKWRLGSLRLNVRLRGHEGTAKPNKRAVSAKADNQPKASKPRIYSSAVKAEHAPNRNFRYINHRRKYLFLSLIYLFPSKKYIFPSLKYINQREKYINGREKYVFLPKTYVSSWRWPQRRKRTRSVSEGQHSSSPVSGVKPKEVALAHASGSFSLWRLSPSFQRVPQRARLQLHLFIFLFRI